MDPRGNASSGQPREGLGKLSEIQVLRAIAAGLVVYGHAIDLLGPAQVTGRPPDWTHGLGAWGVDLFFVISGFIIARSAWPEDRDPLPGGLFMVRRWGRIAPPYWFWSAIAFVWLTLRAGGFSWQAVVKTFTFVPVVDGPVFVLPVLFVGWSLAYEMAFYVSVSVALAARARSPLPILGLAVAMALASLLVPPGNAAASFAANALWAEFGAGIILARVAGELRTRLGRAGWVLIAGGVVGWIASPRWCPLPIGEFQQVLDGSLDGARVLFWGIPAVAVVAGALAVGERILPDRIRAGFVKLGDASYSWYLTHLITLPLVARIWRMANGADTAVGFVLVGLAASGLFAYGAFRWIEQPLCRWAVAPWKEKTKSFPPPVKTAAP